MGELVGPLVHQFQKSFQHLPLALKCARLANFGGVQTKTLASVRPHKKFFVSPTTFCRVEMCHQDSVIRDIKLGQKRA